jgi:hypothetical protein
MSDRILTLSLAAAMTVSSVAAQPFTNPRRQTNVASQERCADEAARSFRLSGWKTEDGSTYKSHYNRTLSACLIEIEGRSSYGVTESVSDAVENRTYAIYMRVVDGIDPMICQLIPSENEKRDCATEEEYKTFAATLMEHH